MNEDVLKEAIKKRWEKYHPNENQEGLFDITNPYYFNDADNNLIATMSNDDKTEYRNGSGNEQDKKMKALHSSSAMTFNIFRNKDAKREVHIIDNEVSKQYGLNAGTYNLKFEKQLPALNPQAPANLDACLISKDNISIILFEMKMTEWLLRSPSTLSLSYNPIELKTRNVFADFTKAFAELINEYIYKENGKIVEYGSTDKYYKCKTGYFDVFQIIKHMIGIYKGLFEKNIKEKYKLPPANNVQLIIGYWTVPDIDEFFKFDNKKKYEKILTKYEKILTEMEIEIDKFIQNDYCQKVKDLFRKKGLEFNVNKMSVKEIISCLDKTNDEIKALRRYIEYVEGAP